MDLTPQEIVALIQFHADELLILLADGASREERRAHVERLEKLVKGLRDG